MIYSSPEFFSLFFFLFIGYSFAGNHKLKHFLLSLSSLVFYAWGGILDTGIFLFILIIAWLSAFLATRYPRYRTFLLNSGIGLLAAHLILWKYLPWILKEGQVLFPLLKKYSLELPLPLGISFFTLQGVAYLIDFRKELVPLIPFRDFFLFKSFFPQLVAGPIVRAQEFYPQIKKLGNITIANIYMGLPLFITGLFKKLAIADRVAPYLDSVFAHPANYNRESLLLALMGYTVQIWADFSGYTDMGRGIAHVFGIRLPENFLSPYLAIKPSEFWKRWHITLSQWIRDYLYIPMMKKWGHGFKGIAFVLILTMSLSGLWHGANWTFLFWGWYHGILLVLEKALERTKVFPKFPTVLLWPLMFSATMFGWLLFRSQNLTLFLEYLISFWHGNGASQISSTRHILCSFLFCLGYQSLLYLRFNNPKIFIQRLLEQKQPAALKLIYHPIAVFFLGIVSAIVAWGSVFLAAMQSSRAFIYFQF